MDESTMLSRSGRLSSSDQKLTRRLDVPISEELEEAVIALAAVSRVTRAEMARFLIERAIFGEMSMLRSVNCLAGARQLEDGQRNVG